MQTAQQESVSDLTRKSATIAFFTAYDDLDTARMIGGYVLSHKVVALPPTRTCFFMKTTLSLLTALLLTISGCSVKTYYIVRHADRVPGQDAITPAGEIRTRVLADSLRSKGVQRIFSTNTARTRRTAQPLSSAINVPITLYSADTLANFAAMLKKQPNSLIVGHSNTILETARALGASPTATTILETEFDKLLIVRRTKNWFGPANTTVTETRYGAVTR
jgi:phosphohistidine phosphatase SixA